MTPDTATPSPAPTALDLIGLLRHELVALERVLFRATTLRMLLLAGNPRHLAWASQELDTDVEAAAQIEARRAVVSAAVNTGHGLAPDAPMSALARTLAASERDQLVNLGRELAERGELIRAEIAVVRKVAPAGQKAMLDQLDLVSGITARAHNTGGSENLGAYAPGDTPASRPLRRL